MDIASKSKIFLTLFIFLVLNIILLFAFYEFLKSNGFSGYEFFIASIIFLFGIAVAFYLLISDFSEEKEELDKKLIDITKEMLHESNIPIATIKANIELLKRKINDDKSLKRLERIILATKSLEKQQQKMSYLIKKEVLEIEKEQVDVKELVIELIEDFKLIAKHNFLLNLESCQIKVDKIGLREAISNILSNAVKYSKSDIEISLKNCTLTITDYGIGIEPQELLKIYEKYYQGDSRIEGNGIGLHIVKSFCDKEGIELEIDSKRDEYTKVKMRFQIGFNEFDAI